MTRRVVTNVADTGAGYQTHGVVAAIQCRILAYDPGTNSRRPTIDAPAGRVLVPFGANLP
jgi:hypothetical protein